MEQSTSSMFLGPVFVLRVFWSVLQRHCRSSAHLWAPESLDVCRHQVLCLAARPDGSAAPGGQRLIENSSVTVWRKFVWWRIVHFLCVSVCVCVLFTFFLCVSSSYRLSSISLSSATLLSSLSSSSLLLACSCSLCRRRSSIWASIARWRRRREEELQLQSCGI